MTLSIGGLFPVWSARTWLATTHLTVGIVLGPAGAALLLAVPCTGGLLLLTSIDNGTTRAARRRRHDASSLTIMRLTYASGT
ncbi:hypothetical protein AB0F81_51150, partial [Actinoplanes sp. NPDC024001]|uniref:hypothetical protein n=1 Tax=Actinoplanes sp. NPDC024001 TaxID=3154598 RepID=UPI0033C9CFDA